MKDSLLKIFFVLFMVIITAMSRVNHKDDSKITIKAALGKNKPEPSLIAAIKPTIIIDKKNPKEQGGNADIYQTLPIQRINTNIADPKLQVKAAFAKDLSTNIDLYQFNNNIKWPLASLTKLMSAVVAIEEVGLGKEIAISESAIAAEGIAGNFQAGEKYNIGELVKAMIIISSNDAATAIAESYGTQNFVNKMQSKAAILGMEQTVFADPTGISPSNQGSVNDLEKLIRYIDQVHPSIFKLSAQKQVEIFEEEKETGRVLLNINNFSSRSDFLGGKTGFTDEANGNLISLFDYKGHKIFIIVLGTTDRFNQTDILYNWIKKNYIFN